MQVLPIFTDTEEQQAPDIAMSGAVEPQQAVCGCLQWGGVWSAAAPAAESHVTQVEVRSAFSLATATVARASEVGAVQLPIAPRRLAEAQVAPETPRSNKTSWKQQRVERACTPCTPSTTASDSSPRSFFSPRELRCCRFCLDVEDAPFEDEVDATAGNCKDVFVSPCPCRGSAKYVHLECLIGFFVAQESWHNFKCPTCKQQYEGRAFRELAEIGLDRVTQLYGPDAPQVADSLCYLAQAQAQLGNTRLCKDFLERGLAISQAYWGRGHVATAATLAELALAHGKLGNAQVQKDLLERSLEIKEKRFGAGHINTAVTLNNLATAHSELGNVLHEKELLERSLEIKERFYGKGHVQNTAALVNLAGVYNELGDLEKGRKLLEWSLEIEERHFGEGHMETAITLNNLALAHGEGGDMQKMHDLLIRCLSIKEHHFGSHHAELCLTLVSLGIACAAIVDVENARSSCLRALSACEGRASRRFGVVLLRTTSVHIALHEETQAVTHFNHAVTILQEALGSSASERVLALECTRIGRIWTAAGRPEVSRRLQRLAKKKGRCDEIADSSDLQWPPL